MHWFLFLFLSSHGTLRFGDDGDVPSNGEAADAVAAIKSRYAGCFALRWPRDKKRDEYWPFDPLDDREQDWCVRRGGGEWMTGVES